MIAKLKGIVDSVGDGQVVLDVGGVGYLVFCSSRTLGGLVPGEAAILEIETHVREDHIHLYGFVDSAEREWFRILTTVQGVGAKVGLGLLSVLSGEEMMQAIATGDKTAITRANGVGPKLATRILTELKDKVGAIALGAAALSGSPSTGPAGVQTSAAVSDAASALVNLGYNPGQALSAVSRLAGEFGPDATVEELIRGGLKELAAGGGVR